MQQIFAILSAQEQMRGQVEKTGSQERALEKDEAIRPQIDICITVGVRLCTITCTCKMMRYTYIPCVRACLCIRCIVRIYRKSNTFARACARVYMYIHVYTYVSACAFTCSRPLRRSHHADPYASFHITLSQSPYFPRSSDLPRKLNYSRVYLTRQLCKHSRLHHCIHKYSIHILYSIYYSICLYTYI